MFLSAKQEVCPESVIRTATSFGAETREGEVYRGIDLQDL